MQSKRTGCSCEKCKECCTREPGWFIPEEVPLVAKFLNLPEHIFINRYCVEHFEDNVYTISPKTKDASDECVFLNDKGLCDIHPVKPYECRKVYGCGGISRHRRIREIIKRMWK